MQRNQYGDYPGMFCRPPKLRTAELWGSFRSGITLTPLPKGFPEPGMTTAVTHVSINPRQPLPANPWLPAAPHGAIEVHLKGTLKDFELRGCKMRIVVTMNTDHTPTRLYLYLMLQLLHLRCGPSCLNVVTQQSACEALHDFHPSTLQTCTDAKRQR